MSGPLSEKIDLRGWPRDPANGRLLCSPAKPMPKGAPGQWSHTSVISTGSSYYYDTGQEVDRYHCRDCGESWREEVAQ